MRKSLAPKARDYRPGCRQHKECKSVESKGFWQAVKKGETNKPKKQVAGLVVYSDKRL